MHVWGCTHVNTGPDCFHARKRNSRFNKRGADDCVRLHKVTPSDLEELAVLFRPVLSENTVVCDQRTSTHVYDNFKFSNDTKKAESVARHETVTGFRCDTLSDVVTGFCL